MRSYFVLLQKRFSFTLFHINLTDRTAIDVRVRRAVLVLTWGGGGGGENERFWCEYSYFL